MDIYETTANELEVKSTTANDATALHIVPNGTSNVGELGIYDGPNKAASGHLHFISDGTNMIIESTHTGAAHRDLQIKNGGSLMATFESTGATITIGSGVDVHMGGDTNTIFGSATNRIQQINMSGTGLNIYGSSADANTAFTLNTVAGQAGFVFGVGGASAVDCEFRRVSAAHLSMKDTYLVLRETDTDSSTEAAIWYDASENKIKFYDGAAVRTITSS